MPGNTTQRTPRVAVIGSGFGGLAAALRLQADGCNVVLFEARDRPGGRAYVYHDKGFTFDAGPTVITAPHCLEELFALTGRKLADHVTLLPVMPFYRLLWDDGFAFDYSSDLEHLASQITRKSPPDVAGYHRFLDYSRRVFAKGYDELAAVPFLRFWDMIRVAPDLIRLRADRSVYSTVSRFIQDEQLRQAFSFHSLLVGGNPFDTSSIYTLIHYLERNWGVFFPKGGTSALVQALANYFGDLGGTLRLSTPVRRVRVENTSGSRPRHHIMTDHKEEAFDVVVSNADVMHTYSCLYHGHAVAAQRTRRLEKMKWSMSLFVLYFGTDRRYENLAHHTIIFGPRYRELLNDIDHGKEIASDFSLYLHAPTVTDTSLAPPGCETFYVLAPVPHLGQVPVDWDSFAPEYAERILKHLERWLPDLRKHIVVRRWFTPKEFRDELNAHLGSAFSVSPLLTQSAYFRPHNRDAGIPGLYLVGAGTHPGAGVPGVVNSAKATAQLILEEWGR
jgi:phytoene desaturase